MDSLLVPRRRYGYSDSYYDDDYSDGVGIAVAVWVVIVLLGLMGSLFFWSTIYFTIQERKRTKQGHPFRLGHVLWSAFKIATFLWIPIKIYRCCRGERKDKGQYARVDGGQNSGQNNPNGWYGYAPAASYPAGGNYAPGKFEPMGYAGAGPAVGNPHTSPSPGPQQGPVPGPPPYNNPQGYYPAPSPSPSPSPYPQYPNQVPTAPAPPAQVAYPQPYANQYGVQATYAPKAGEPTYYGQ